MSQGNREHLRNPNFSDVSRRTLVATTSDQKATWPCFLKVKAFEELGLYLNSR